MESKDKIYLLMLITAIILSTLFSYSHYVHKEKEEERDIYYDTIRKEIIDTIPYYKPVPKDSVMLRYVTVKVNDDKETDVNNTDSIQIPITQKMYEDSLYRCYVSGYQCNLDSLILKYRQQQIITTITPPCPPDKNRRWSVGIHIGYGVTINKTPQFCPYIGVGVSYKLFEF